MPTMSVEIVPFSTPRGLAALANHSSPRSTKLYDRRSDETSLDEYEKVGI